MNNGGDSGMYQTIEKQSKEIKAQPYLLGFFMPATFLTVMKPVNVAYCWRWLHGGYTVQNPVLVATWWLHEAQSERVCYFIYSGKPLLVLVGTERFELSTYGLRVRCSTS